MIPNLIGGRWSRPSRDTLPIANPVCGGVPVHPGDVVLAAQDGVVVVPRLRLAEVVAAVQAVGRKEADLRARMQRGERLAEILGMTALIYPGGSRPGGTPPPGDLAPPAAGPDVHGDGGHDGDAADAGRQRRRLVDEQDPHTRTLRVAPNAK